MAGNPFLTEFINLRKTLAPQAGPSSGFVSQSVLPQKEEKKSKNTKQSSKPKKEIKLEQDYSEVNINHIIEQKPRRRIVVDWLQTRANELSRLKNA